LYDIKEQILNTFNFRHACKEFNPDKKITEEDFNLVLETARLSPSSFGFEPWRFLVIQNRELRDKIRSVSWGTMRQLPDASHFVVILARNKHEMIYSSEYISNIMKEVQHLPEDVYNDRKKKYENFQRNDFRLLESGSSLFDWACKQTYIALANMITSAAMLGIDSCPIEGFDRNKLETLLEDEGILDRSKFGVSCMAAFGYRKNNPRAKTRQPLYKIVEWI
jgi:nitroreductase